MKILNQTVYYPLLISLLIIIFTYKTADSRSLVKPLLYPLNSITNIQPYFIWKDIYAYKDGSRTEYRVSLKRIDENSSETHIFTGKPQLFFREYYSIRLPNALNGSAYEYTIERIFNKKQVKSRYFNYLNYPIKNSFVIDRDSSDPIDNLSPPYLIQYKFYEKENMLRNGYNFMFFSASSTISLGIGYLFYSIINLGAAGTVITVLCVLSSAIGYPAAGYYGYRYMQYRSKMNDILEIGNNIKLRGSLNQKMINTEAQLRF